MKRLKIINAIGEAAIPLMGLLFFDWGIYFILLFYFIDLVATEVFVYIKVNKIIQFQKINFPFSIRYGRLMYNSFLMLSLVVIAHIAVYIIVPDIDFLLQITEFLSYEEAGIPIPQGYILLPLVILGNFQQYKTLFIKTGEFRRSSWKVLIFSRRKALYIAMIGGVIAIPLAYFVSLPSYVYILTVIVIKFYIDISQKQY
ncbi:MAG TPA: hypothetical protein VFD77_03770 [Brumimicrobium sp.]|nr:hypothetical protein [Brumimicrobium sp.]